jgi:hypothetical protein
MTNGLGGRSLAPTGRYSSSPILLMANQFLWEMGRLLRFCRKIGRRLTVAIHSPMHHGGTVEGKPGLRPEYHPDYYRAYFRDPDENKLCVCRHNA